MKKTLRAILAAMLAALMAFSGLTAFAAANTDTQLEWDYYGDSYYYDYAGELTEGDNSISYDDKEYVYFTFDAQNEGFYAISYEYDNLDAWIGLPERYENGKAYDEADFSSYYPENSNGVITRYEKGEHLIILEYYYLADTASFKIEFLGEEITEINVASDLIYNYDIYDYEWEGENCFDIEAETEIVFSSGKTITRDYISGTCENEITKGENALTVEFCGKEYELTANVSLITDYVESVSVSNIEDYLYIKSYYNSYDFSAPYGETFTVTFKDGTSDSFVYGDDDNVTLPNGRDVWCYMDYDYDAEKLSVFVAGTCFAEYDCELTSASIGENIDEMNYNNSIHLEMVSYYLRRAMEVAFEDGIYGFMNGGAEMAMMRIQWAIESFMYVFTEAAALMIYYLA